ncbi:ErfK/YbiS/YcfS/YnhG family protein [Magnetococcus marinus MC-1]|uniref:ErfK/YbiS/YcfS/YnhG family protein n=1 Tax=Magnetococcus marinus (strain ATCC BAA-1437 / JCM 17883 / MC-1) TaxID=156889 RepID=A0LDB3_MAGMM|nr:L,D-transpeptidase [Magnetococcus marinus]ABK45956.1 ErfK/YbiS/YcfS/YnhG family protein [Magnetococcus marinus MC-1]
MIDPQLREQALSTLVQHGWSSVRPGLYLHGPSQRLMGFYGEQSVLGVWPVSTGLKGFGNAQDSGQTPMGLHTLGECIGAGQPLGMCFVGRQATGQIVETTEDRSRDYITTRIIRLCGAVPGFNQGPGVDSYERYIYIHGTPHLADLGQPVSHGCVRMHSAHLLELFDQVGPGDLLYIEPGR